MEWNDSQIKIANALIEGQSAQEAADQCEVSIALVYRVRQALKKAGGEIPSSNDQVMPSTVIKKMPASPKITHSTSAASFLEFSPQVQKFALTPDIFMSYMRALMEGYKEDLGQWISLVSRDFWLGRGRNFYAEVASFDPNILRKEEEEKSGVTDGQGIPG